MPFQYPKLAVLIPHYNEPEAILKSLKSIEYDGKLAIVIVNDGSKKKYDKEKIESIGSDKYTYHFLSNESNQGIERTLNKGLKFIYENLSDYSYVARLDCGDLCINDRLNKQIQFLEKHPNIHLLGAQIELIDTEGNFLFSVNLPLEHDKIMKRMFFNNMIYNGTSILKIRPIIETIGYYPLNFPASEDHAYFFSIGKKFEVANMPEFLYRYEINPNSISSLKRRQQVLTRLKIIRYNFYLGYYPIVGFIRNLILLFLSRELTTRLKSIIKSN